MFNRFWFDNPTPITSGVHNGDPAKFTPLTLRSVNTCRSRLVGLIDRFKAYEERLIAFLDTGADHRIPVLIPVLIAREDRRDHSRRAATSRAAIPARRWQQPRWDQ